MVSDRLARRIGATVALLPWLLLGGCNDIEPYQEAVAAAELGIETVALTPGPVLLGPGESQTLRFTATLANGQTSDLTGRARWQVGDATIATVDAKGVIVAIDNGSTFVRATFGRFSAQQTVTVNAAELISLSIDGPATLSVCDPADLTLTGGYSDGSQRPLRDAADWSLEPANAGSIDANGRVVVTADDASDVTTHASRGAVQASRRFPVIHDLDTIELADATLEIEVGSRSTLTATAVYRDGRRVEVGDFAQWQSSNTGVAGIEAGGRLRAVATGSATITVGCGGVEQTLAVTVLPAADVSAIEIEGGKDEVRVRQGQTLTLTASAIFTTGRRSDITNDADWRAETLRGGPITVGNGKDDKGRVDTRSTGEAFIKAEYQNETAYIKVIVEP